MTATGGILRITLLTCALALPSQAAAPPDQVARLGRDLTPLGAIQAGNAVGTIPPWLGGIREPPADYEPGAHHPDPFAADRPLFTITAANLEQHAARLSAGQVAMLERYPESWRLPVYPSRRSAALPQRIYERTVTNAGRAELTPDGNGWSTPPRDFLSPSRRMASRRCGTTCCAIAGARCSARPHR